MIENFGIGNDISSIEKFKNKPFKENENFYKKFFLEQELTYCLKFKKSHEKFAGKFALKEALIKSISEKIHFSKIETTYLNSKPIVKILNSKKKYRFIASLSHDKDYAIAIVISEVIK